MRRILGALMTLAALVVACSEQAPALSPVAPDFSKNVVRASSAAQKVLCTNPSGSLFVRELCRANEEQLDPVALGLVGPQGPPGPPGPPGTSGVSGYEIVLHQEFLSPGAFASVHVECPTGKKVLGGGFNIETPTEVLIFESGPSDGQGNIIDHGWNVFVHNAGSNTRQTTAIAICASVQ